MDTDMDRQRDPAAELLARLLERSGFAEDAVPAARLGSYLAGRARELGLADGAQAALRALADSAEFARAESHFAPPESWLFRYPESFDLLRERAPRRVLVLGAGGWAEPVSIAAALADRGARIEAVDRSAAVFAEPARFAGARARGGVPAWAERALAREGDAWRAEPELLAMISATTGDAAEVARGLARQGAAFDAVFFRNVAIYMGARARREAFAAIAAVLAPDGLLFVGHAETTVAAEATGLAVEVRQGAFALRARVAPPRVDPSEGPKDRAPAPASPAEARRREPAPARPAPRASVDPEARLRSEIAGRPLEAALHLELARLLDARGDRAGAASAVGRALYVDPNLEDALVLGARLAEERGAADEAQRLRARAIAAHLRRETGGDPPRGA
jgi:chemotaxis protein methyltransferase WspC